MENSPGGKAQPKPVVVVQSQEPDLVGRVFETVMAASTELNIDARRIPWSCKTGKSILGITFAYAEQPDFPGEEWREAFFEDLGVIVKASNQGRVMTLRGVKTSGYVKSRSLFPYYRRVNINRKWYYVHDLIARVWMLDGKPIPENCMVGHIGKSSEFRRRRDNCESNLIEDIVIFSKEKEMRRREFELMEKKTARERRRHAKRQKQGTIPGTSEEASEGASEGVSYYNL